MIPIAGLHASNWTAKNCTTASTSSTVWGCPWLIPCTTLFVWTPGMGRLESFARTLQKDRTKHAGFHGRCALLQQKQKCLYSCLFVICYSCLLALFMFMFWFHLFVLIPRLVRMGDSRFPQKSWRDLPPGQPRYPHQGGWRSNFHERWRCHHMNIGGA